VTASSGTAPFPTRSQIENWQSTHLETAALQWHTSASAAENLFEEHRQVIAAPGGGEWLGEAKDVAWQRVTADLGLVRRQSDVQREAAGVAERGCADVRSAQRAVEEAIAAAEADGFTVGEDLSLTDTRSVDASAAERAVAGTQHAEFIRWNAEQLLQTDSLVGKQLTAKAAELQSIQFEGQGGDQGAGIQAVDFKRAPPGLAEDEANRRQNEINAFKEVFGRQPTSAADWATAAVLDPHSYAPESRGVAPEIRVVRIEPVPGQGVVRAGQWIEQRDVISGPWKRDFGNDRVANPNFDPADTKVTTYIDYENGLVVMRQNPSVELNDSGGPGQVKVGIPEAVVQQAENGAVRIRYEAANPFAPEIAQNPPWPLADNPWSVNGDLVFTPTADGVRVDGTRTNYPSMEVYQDMPNGSTRTALIDPAIAGNSTGPMINLPEHHDVGVGGKAYAPFDTGGWNLDYDVKTPLPVTNLGPAADAPTVPAEPTSPGVIQF
jgi:hypothetical protein